MLGFYVFSGKRLCDDYIKFCKEGPCMAMQKKAWMTSFLFKKLLSFFKKSIPCGISQTYRHWLILHGHGSHLTLEAINEMHGFHLNMIIVPSHTYLSF
jgi:hypothetical protein